MTIRKAVLDDLHDIHEVFTKAIEITASPFYSAAQLKAWTSSTTQPERWIKRIKEDYFLVIEVGSEIVGFASLKNSSYVDLLFVHPTYGRQGIAGQLLAKLEEEADKTQVLETHASHISKAFFSKYGFEFIQSNKVEVFNVEMENFLMRKGML